jgi:hypothetical protein
MNIFQSLHLDSTELITFLFLALVFFLIVREIATWYWKINKIVKLLVKIEKNTSLKFNPQSEIAEESTESSPEEAAQMAKNDRTPRSAFDKWWNG